MMLIYLIGNIIGNGSSCKVCIEARLELRCKSRGRDDIIEGLFGFRFVVRIKLSNRMDVGNI